VETAEIDAFLEIDRIRPPIHNRLFPIITRVNILGLDDAGFGRFLGHDSSTTFLGATFCGDKGIGKAALSIAGRPTS
jgi:hypothetical protein